jgi:hypothetical protein
MRNLLAIVVIALLCSCSSDDSPEQFVYDVGVEFSIKDSQGNDLLNPENENTLNSSEIKLFYVVNGAVEEVYDGNMDYPRNYVIYDYAPVSEYRISVFLNNADTEAQPITYIQWNATDTDTLRSEIYRRNNLVKIKTLWLNNELIWSDEDGTEPYFELVK